MRYGKISRLVMAAGLAAGTVGSDTIARASRSEAASLARPLPQAQAPAPRPNIVIVLADDQRFDELRQLPAVHRRLIDRGVSLRRAFVVNSLCCPSRASTLTGAYSHTHGVYLNGDGGYPGGFRDFRDGSTLPVWLRSQGYATAMVGKYLNHYENGSYIPPGWSFWGGLVGANAAYYDYDLSINGRVAHHGSDPGDYATDVFAKVAGRFIRRTNADRPLFLYFAPPAPHGPTTSAPRHEDEPVAAQPRYPSFNEADRRDKPAWVANRPPLTATDIGRIERHWTARARSLMAVDDAVKRLVDALADTGRLRNTLFVYTSDHGASRGEHTLTYKLNPYEESIRIPMIVRWDGRVPSGSISHRLATNIDLAPTFAAAAGAPIPDWVDGRSLLPLLLGDRTVRTSFLIEHQFSHRPEDPPTYCGIRTPRWKLIRLTTGEVELYHLVDDPWERHNLAGKSAFAERRRTLMSRLRILCDPRPPGMAAF